MYTANFCGIHNTAKICTDYSQNICSEGFLAENYHKSVRKENKAVEIRVSESF